MTTESASLLRAFALAVLADWPAFSGMDGGEIQDLAVKHGLLRLKDPAPTVPCSESGCACAEYYGLDVNGQFAAGDPPRCFERTALLLGSEAAPPGVPIDEPEPEPPEHRISASTQHLLDKARFELEHPTGSPLRTAALRHLLACVTAQGFVSSAQLRYLRQFDRELQARR